MDSSKQYFRDSFDRFGDDLCEFLLSYLSISECFVLQCVKHQFNNLIFNKQLKLNIYENHLLNKGNNFGENQHSIKEIVICHGKYKKYLTINQKILNYVWKKCININDITINGEFICEEIILTISKTCKQLKYFGVGEITNVSIYCLKEIVENCLQNIISLSFFGVLDEEKKIFLLKSCPKIKAISSKYIGLHLFIDRCIKENRDFGKCINKIEGYYVCFDESFINFTKFFAKQLITLCVLCEVDSYFPKNTFKIAKNIIKFDGLKYLCIDFIYSKNDKWIEFLSLIGLNCNSLKILKIKNLIETLNKMFKDNEFKFLNKLFLKNCVFEGNFIFLKYCVHLTHLKLNGFNSKTSDFINIHLYLSQLKSIKLINSIYKKQLTIKNLMNHLSKLPNLIELKIGCVLINEDLNYFGITTVYIKSFIENNLSLRRISIYPKHTYIDYNSIEVFLKSNKRKINLDTNFI